MAGRFNLLCPCVKQVSAVIEGELHTVSIVRRQQNCLHVLKNGDEKVSVFAGSSVVDFSAMLSLVDGALTVYCVTDAGLLYRITEDEAKLQLQNKRTTSESPNREIFTDLLSDKDDNMEELECRLATKPVVVLGHHMTLGQLTDYPVSICASGDLVAITTMSDAVQFKLSIFAASGFDSNVQCNLETSAVRVSYISDSIMKLQRSLEEVADLPRKVVTKCVMSQSVQCSDVSSTDCLLVSDKLFVCMFGEDTSLLNSPVFLLCPPGGGVYSTALRSLRTQGSANEQGCRLFCHTSSSVSDILVVSPRPGTGQQQSESHSHNSLSPASSLCVVSQNGVVHIVQAGTRDHVTGSQFTKLLIPGPVLDVCSCRDTVFHTTGKSLYQTKISLHNDDEVHTKASVVESNCYGRLGIVGLVPKENDSMPVLKDSFCLLCCDNSGKLTEFCTTAERSRAGKQQQLANPGQRIRDLLTCIDCVENRRQKAYQLFQFQNVHLSQINLAACLIRNLQSCNAQSSPFRCDFRTKFQCSSEGTTLHIDCTITNQMVQPLSHDWGIFVTLTPLVGQCSAGQVVKSLQLTSEFPQQTSVTISVPVEPDWILTGSSLQVFLALTVNRSVLDVTKTEKGCLAIPVHDQPIDVLYFLLPSSPSGSAANNSMHWTSVVKEIAGCRPASGLLLAYNPGGAETESHPADGSGDGQTGGHLGDRKDRGVKVGQGETTTISVPVSITLKAEFFRAKFGDADGVLRYILAHCGAAGIVVDNGQCTVNVMCGQKVHLSVQCTHSVMTASCQITVLVRSGLSTAAAVRKAVVSRLQEFQEDMVTVAELTMQDLHTMSRTLQGVERDLNILQTENNSDTGKQGLSQQQMVPVIKNIYQALNSIDL